MTPQPERVAQYQNLRNVGNDFKASSSQARRRQEALARQKEQRTQAFSLARDGLESVLDDLGISDSSSDEEEQADNPKLDKVNPAQPGRFDDADEDHAQQVSSTAVNGSHVPEASMDATGDTATSKKRKHRGRMPKRIKKKWQLYANRLMQGEELDLDNEGLPSDLATEWIAIGPIPKGHRCMVVTFASTRRTQKGRVTNAILLARTTGRPIARQHIPILPANCVLDCTYVPEAAAIFVVDILQWKGQSVAEGEAEFRMFWRDSMLSELSPQTAPQWPHSPAQAASADMAEDDAAPVGNIKLKPSHLLVLPVPCLSASSDFLRQLLQELVLPCSVDESGEAQIMVASDDSSFSAKRHMVPYTIPYRTEGISLLVKSAAYESGPSPLAAWVPRSQLHRIVELASSI